MSVVIRQATETDYDRVGQVFADELEFHVNLLPDRFQLADPVMTRQWFSEIITNPNKVLLVADLEGTLIGLVLIELKTSPDDPIFLPRRYAFLDEVVVVESFRGQGVGRLLMAQAHEWITEQGIGEVELNVWESNTRAIVFYERLGYRTLSRKLKLVLD